MLLESAVLREILNSRKSECYVPLQSLAASCRLVLSECAKQRAREDVSGKCFVERLLSK